MFHAAGTSPVRVPRARRVERAADIGLSSTDRRLPWPQDTQRSADKTFAEELVLTPRHTEGPFYPDDLPLDTDNDLLIVNDAITPAVGAITHLVGRVLDKKGSPQRGIGVEISRSAAPVAAVPLASPWMALLPGRRESTVALLHRTRTYRPDAS